VIFKWRGKYQKAGLAGRKALFELKQCAESNIQVGKLRMGKAKVVMCVACVCV